MCIFNRGSNRGWADIQGKELLLFGSNLAGSIPEILTNTNSHGKLYTIVPCGYQFIKCKNLPLQMEYYKESLIYIFHDFLSAMYFHKAGTFP